MLLRELVGLDKVPVVGIVKKRCINNESNVSGPLRKLNHIFEKFMVNLNYDFIQSVREGLYSYIDKNPEWEIVYRQLLKDNADDEKFLEYRKGKFIMDRSVELEESIRDYWGEHTKAKRAFLLQNYTELEAEFYNKLSLLVVHQSGKPKEDCQEKIKYIYLCRLMSSGYTESYQAILGMSSFMFHLDENKSETFWFPELIYKNIDQDMEEVKELLQKKFIQLKGYELFRIKQKLLCDDWKLLKECFLLLINNSISLVTDSSLPLEDELEVLSGDYMDKLETLWHMSVE